MPADIPTNARLQLGTEMVDYALVHSARRRRTIALQIIQGRLVITAPPRTPQREIESIILTRAQWIQRSLREAAQVQERRAAHTGMRAHLGQHYEIEVREQTGRRVAPVIEGNRIILTLPVGSDESFIEAKLNNWQRAEARILFKTLLDEWALKFGVRYGRFLLTSPAKRWGSCDAHNNIRLNWRLMMTPLSAIEYVVAHELAHVLHKDHSPRFWSALERVMPDYAARQKLLTQYGRELME